MGFAKKPLPPPLGGQAALLKVVHGTLKHR